jgi:hypothetical protein
MLNGKNLLNYFLVEVMAIIIYILNRKFTTIVHDTTFEKFIDMKPNNSHLWVFGCITYMHVLDEKRALIYEGMPINANVYLGVVTWNFQ